MFILVSDAISTALNAAEVMDKMGLRSLRYRNWYIQPSCGYTGDGLYEGLDWLRSQQLGR